MPDLAEQVMGQINSQGASPASTEATPPPAASPGAGGAPAASAPASPVQGANAGSPGVTAPASPQYTSLLDAARTYGFQPPEGMNEHQLLQHLIAQANQSQQLQTMAGYGQEFLKHRSQFQSWMDQQRQAELAKQQQNAKWWSPPEFNPAWRTQVYRDPQTQELKTLPTVSPVVAEKYQQYQAWERETLDKILQDPLGTLKPGLEQMIQEIAGQMLQHQTAQFQDVNYSQQFLRENANWLYEKDQGGNPTARLSQWGARFKGHVDSLIQMGMRGDQMISQHALALTDREYLATQLRQQQGQQAGQAQGQQQKESFLQQAAARAVTPAQTGGNLPGQVQSNGQAGAAQNPSLGLMQRMMQGMKAHGVTDAQIQDSLGRRAG